MNVKTLIHSASRDALAYVLESYGFQVYDNESGEALKEAVRANLEDGTMTEESVQAMLEEYV